MSQYTRGRRKERKVMAMLRELGAQVTRSAGSKGLWDVAGLFPDGVIWLIAVKYTAAKTGQPWRDANWRLLEKQKLAPGVLAGGFVYHKGRAHPDYYELGFHPAEDAGRVAVVEKYLDAARPNTLDSLE